MGILGGYCSPAAGHFGESTAQAGRLDVEERRGDVCWTRAPAPGAEPCPLQPEGTREPLQALGREHGIRLGFRKLAWGCRVQMGNPAVSSKAWARDGEQKRVSGSPFTGSMSSRQGLFPPRVGPQAPCLGVLSRHMPLILLASSMAPLPFGDHIPGRRRSSHKHLVPFPTRLHRQSWD